MDKSYFHAFYYELYTGLYFIELTENQKCFIQKYINYRYFMLTDQINTRSEYGKCN